MTESKEKLISALKQAYESGILSLKEYESKLDSIVNPSETFSSVKFKRVFSLLDPVEWIKSLKELGILDLRKWIIFALIAGCIYGWGYVKGIGNKKVTLDLHGKEVTIALNEHFLHILPDGTAQVEDKDGKVLKIIRTKDIPELRKALKPIGVDIKPFFTAGLGSGAISKTRFEAGVGTSLFKIYKVHIDTWATNLAIYLGADYQVTTNSGVLLGLGHGYKGDQRVYLGWKWNF